MSQKLQSEIALVLGLVVAALEAVNVTVINPPTWLTIVLAVAIAVAGALGVRARVTPVATARRRTRKEA